MSEKRMSDVISSFQKKLKRFSQTENNVQNYTHSSLNDLQQKIVQNEKDFETNVISTYNMYRSPFEVLGKQSLRAQSITEDENELYKAYTIFKAIVKINQELGDSNTRLSSYKITTPLVNKSAYTQGATFIYLQAYLMFQKDCSDYVPSFEIDTNEKYNLIFTKTDSYKFTPQAKEILACIKKNFYS